MYGGAYYGQPYWGQGPGAEAAGDMEASVQGIATAAADLLRLALFEASISGVATASGDAQRALALMPQAQQGVAIASGVMTRILGTLYRHEAVLDLDGPNEMRLDFEPFEWPRSNWDRLALRIVDDKGSGMFKVSGLSDTEVLARLAALWSGSFGQVVAGMVGNVVQIAKGTGRSVFKVRDWRGNEALFVFQPADGLDVEEIQGSHEDGQGHRRVQIVLIKLGT